jgi:hypothetical protein
MDVPVGSGVVTAALVITSTDCEFTKGITMVIGKISNLIGICGNVTNIIDQIVGSGQTIIVVLAGTNIDCAS